MCKDVSSSRSVSEPESPVSGRAGCETVLTCRSREDDVVDAWEGDLERGDGEPSLVSLSMAFWGDSGAKSNSRRKDIVRGWRKE